MASIKTACLSLGALSTFAAPAFAQLALQSTFGTGVQFAFPAAIGSASSGSSSLIASPDAPTPGETGAGTGSFRTKLPDVSYRPFKTYAVGLRLGLGGIGGEISTPLTNHLALRGGFQAFSYSTTINTNGLTANGTLKLGDGFASLDYFPFRNGFHISPGYTLHNGDKLNATILVPGGQTFTLDNTDYTSSPTDPIKGNASLAFGNKTAPRITMGIGNPFPKSGGHWSFPVEIGFEYISYPKIALALSGTGCTGDTVLNSGCGSINSPENQANINGEIAKINNDIAPARFFPIFSFGLDYRFGH